ncbi:MAG: peptidoglycan editing factor PgeF [Boseongicola sp.]|nr:peptidoglycan editing factor PgeF [Boseongicola sp.]
MTLEILTSDMLNPIKHGFFTRRGGASSGVFEGLNCGLGSSDQREIVLINRGRVAEAMSVELEHMAGVHQVHSARVVTVNSGINSNVIEADAMVTNAPDVCLSILTADCQPVLFADTNAGVIGAAHAGWKGAANGVLEATIEEMVSLGATREHIRAAIGPTISQTAYEVGPEFFEAFVDDDPENSRFFAGGNGNRMHFDLPAYGLHCMRDAGLRDVEWIRHCTYSDPDRFYSYRRSVHAQEADYGRLISTIRL